MLINTEQGDRYSVEVWRLPELGQGHSGILTCSSSFLRWTGNFNLAFELWVWMFVCPYVALLLWLLKTKDLYQLLFFYFTYKNDIFKILSNQLNEKSNTV